MRKTISVIVPVFNEEENIGALYERLDAVASGARYDFEFVFVDDGSEDASYGMIRDLSAKDGRVKGVRFSRNFGSHTACLAGLAHASGDACTFIAADLQDPPEVILALAAQWEKGIEVVFGVRRWEQAESRRFADLYWGLVKRYALRNMPRSGTDVFLVDRRVAEAVVGMGEKNSSIFGLILWSGFSQGLVTYTKGARTRGRSKWSVGKKVKLFVDTFVSFSYLPIRMISVAGLVIAAVGFLYAAVVVLNRFLSRVPVEGWSSLMVVILILSGLQLVMLGVIGEYLWRNYDESRKRPLYIVRETTNQTAAAREDGGSR